MEIIGCLARHRLGIVAAVACVLGTMVSCSTARAEPENGLSSDGIYPHGRKLAFMGYSGDPARDLANGFTVAGPVYGDQTPYLNRCFEHGWPVVAHIGPQITFNDKAPGQVQTRPGQPAARGREAGPGPCRPQGNRVVGDPSRGIATLAARRDAIPGHRR